MASKLDQSLVALVKSALSGHNAVWDAQRANLKLYRDLYASRFFGDTKGDPSSIRVETGDGPAHIESYLASLFSRSPAVEIGGSKAEAGGDPRIASAVANGWLGKQREVFEQTTRLGLLYPCAFLRVGPDDGDGFEVRAVCPWDVIVDAAAPTWAHQRWVGHRYTLPLAKAKARFPNVANASWHPNAEKRYFEQNTRRKADSDVPADLQLVTIVEFYDLVRNKLVFFSPDKDYGETPIRVAGIPIRLPGTAKPAHPIVPVYFAYEPDSPVVGIATISRIYDQLREKNLLRTNAANCIRRDSRQYLARKGAFSEDDALNITRGVDGAIVWVPVEVKGKLEDLIAEVPVSPMSSNFDKYGAMISEDLANGSVLAAFTRGEATRATATEIGVLAEYSASAIGRMARIRDAAIEQVTALYLAHVMLSKDEEDEDQVVATASIDGQTVEVRKEDLDHAWTITALDQAATPISKAIEQQRFLALVPILQGLGISAAAIVAQLVRLELVPVDFGAAEALAPPAGAPAPGAPPPGPSADPTIDDLIRQATTGRSVADAAPGNALPAAA